MVTTCPALYPLLPVFVSYVLSFVYVGIYWNNHHHMLHAARQVNGPILWANLHLLFWLSLIPFVTGWMGENHFASLPVALYGAVLLMAGIAYFILDARADPTPRSGFAPRRRAGQRCQGQGVRRRSMRSRFCSRSPTAGLHWRSTCSSQSCGSFRIGESRRCCTNEACRARRRDTSARRALWCRRQRIDYGWRTTASSLLTSSVRACSAICAAYLAWSCFASPSIDVNACCSPAASILRPPA